MIGRPPNKPHDVWRYIDVRGGPDACWLWKRKGRGGYDGRPYFNVDGVKRLAYRLAYEQFYDITLDDSDYLRHTCGTQSCCNPQHLQLINDKELTDD